MREACFSYGGARCVSGAGGGDGDGDASEKGERGEAGGCAPLALTVYPKERRAGGLVRDAEAAAVAVVAVVGAVLAGWASEEGREDGKESCG